MMNGPFSPLLLHYIREALEQKEQVILFPVSYTHLMLDSVYPIVWMDAIHYKVTDERGCAVTRAIYNAVSYTHLWNKQVSRKTYMGNANG